jgi:Mycobacterium membrane protein
MVFAGVLERGWIPLVVLGLTACGGFAVSWVRSGFGSETPRAHSNSTMTDAVFSPKSVVYKVFGPVGAADIGYFDVTSDPHQADGEHYAGLRRSRRMFGPSWVTLLHTTTTTALAAGSW